MNHSKVEIEKVIEEIRLLVLEEGVVGDIQYFSFHEKRFSRMANTISKTAMKGAKILDIGSHYLHSGMILTKLGYQVVCMDVQEFWSIPFVQDRAKVFEIEKCVHNNLELLKSDEVGVEAYDLVLFTEILEHITFNPINFWKELYAITKDGGSIYISTPNSLSLSSILRTLKNVFTFKGIGVSIEMIFARVTYGHHWKEYSAREIRNYFSQLNDDFKVKVERYSYQKFDNSTTALLCWSLLRVFGSLTYIFSSDLEAIVTVNKSVSDNWKLQSPNY